MERHEEEIKLPLTFKKEDIKGELENPLLA